MASPPRLSSPRVRLPALLAACCALFTACSEPLPEAPPLTSQKPSLAGVDGDLTVTEVGRALNQYAILGEDVSAGATSLVVTAATDLNASDFGPLSSGDLLFIIQMQGASIDISDSPDYGTVTNLNGTGLYEFAVVRQVVGNTIHLACSGLKNSYTKAGQTQVVRVPQFRSLTIAEGALVVPVPWTGQRGGIVVLHVDGTTTLSGDIDVSEDGFRGGLRHDSSNISSNQITLYRTSDAQLGAAKGESIAGYASAYAGLGGGYGRGAPANGGGGGNSHNAGGGGGANGNNSHAWHGQGVMRDSVTGAQAWQLDPAYLANGMLTDESGGGRGGYSYSSLDEDAFSKGPGETYWGGNFRAEVGGLGGRPLDNDPASRLFMGGGGGAGDGNNSAAGSGGTGGGIVYLISTNVSGTGRIRANGGPGQQALLSNNDAPGGGAAGGTVIVLSSNLSGISVEANGGTGGNQNIGLNEAEGPGGGGGGGYIALSGGTVTASANGGASGTTTSPSLSEFPVNGATFGADGQVLSTPALPLPWLSCAPINLAITITDGQSSAHPDATVRYTVTVTNSGPSTATNAPVSVPVPADTSGATWTCAASAGASCQTAGGSGAIATSVTVPPGGKATFTLEVHVSPTSTGPLVATATVSEPAPLLDGNPANNSATDTDTVVPEADLGVTLTESADPAPNDRPLTYTVHISNDGPNAAANVEVSFGLPLDATFLSASGAGWNCSQPTSDSVLCTRPSVANGGAPDISIVVMPTIASGTLNVFAEVFSDTPDPSENNNSAQEETTIAAPNEPPVNTVPGAQSTPEDTALLFSSAGGNALSAADPDAGSELVQVTLTSTHGTLTLGATSGLTFSSGDGTADASMTFTGTLAAINAALEGLRFAPDGNYNGSASLTLTTNDLGHSGAGGPLTDTDTVPITVTPVNDPPSAVDDTATVTEGTTENPIDVLANDTSAPDSGETLTVTGVTQGDQGGTVAVTDGGTRIHYTPAPGFSGTETFTYTLSDGNGGTDSATVTVTVTKLPEPPEPIERRVVGGGCSTSGSGSPPSAFWMLLALVGLTRVGRQGARTSGPRGARAVLALGVVAVLAASGPAQAQSSSAIDVQQFKPAPGKADVLGLEGPGVPGHLSWSTGLYLQYAHDPLVIINPRNEALLQHLVKNQVGFDLVGAIGLGERFELGASIPISLQHGEFNEQASGSLEQTWKGGLGDLRLIPKVLLLEGESLRLGLAAPVVLPTGGSTALRGEKGVGVQPRLATDYTFDGGTRLLANVGVNLRSRQELLNLSVGNELSYGLGAAIPFQVQGHPLIGLASVAGAFGLGATGGTNEEEIPLELQAGLQYPFSKSMVATLGAGRGLTLGYGMPVFRVFTGVTWTAEEQTHSRPRDSDNDGVPDVADKCPDQPEDRDGFQDEDGCPDPDNDQDGIADVADKCPNQPEDKDGFQDEDGCPDPDNDHDGIADTVDKCPNEPEDKDGFQDEDGCPDPDNDQDGIADAADKCPNQPEDKDGFQDEDGCPDPDNDHDGIPDAEDQCPLEPEVINGVDDSDGCPDIGESKVQLTATKIVIREKVYFATNKDVVLARSFPLLQQVASLLRANPEIKKVRIEGHTDSRADDAFNLDLSQRRAGNVRKYLVEQANIAPERLDAVGFGETRPVDTNLTAAGRENNRRVEFIIVEQEGVTPAP
ncbi:MAG: Ig-like domain-containing protein [Hyalangium sp.]|uniref:Ig-like domain-containing protein n=1 Tax=Hyalangium sp. TaxID=2028555 RepID=UPI003899A721